MERQEEREEQGDYIQQREKECLKRNELRKLNPTPMAGGALGEEQDDASQPDRRTILVAIGLILFAMVVLGLVGFWIR